MELRETDVLPPALAVAYEELAALRAKRADGCRGASRVAIGGGPGVRDGHCGVRLAAPSFSAVTGPCDPVPLGDG